MDTLLNSSLDSITPLLQQLKTAGFRLPVVLCGDQDWAIAQVQAWLTQQGIESALWFSQRAPAHSWTLPLNRINHELGRECEVAVFDVYSGLNLDALASLVGTVVAGGCFILITPELEKLSEFEDPFASQLAVTPWTAADVGRNFLARLSRQLIHSPEVAVIGKTRSQELPSLAAEAPWRRISDSKGCVTTDQRKVVDAIEHWFFNRVHQPFVIQADRGRGKSAAMGIAVASLLKSNIAIGITAPRPQAVETFMGFATAQSSAAESTTLSYFAPDHLLESRPELQLLLIDEAAAIAPNLLEQMVTLYPRIILATTVQGYEGTGRGFQIRFKPFLDQHKPGWQCHYLTEPVRWQQGDWLEGLVNRALILDESNSGQIDQNIQLNQCLVSELSDQEVEQTVNLLVDAHYRTRPNDIRTLLDGANIRTFVVKSHHSVVAVAMVAMEGKVPQELGAAILLGQRRPRGQNLAQSLAVHLQQPDALTHSLWRVVRIAVHPQLQERGFGSWLLTKLEQLAREEAVDVIGSLFSASPSVLQFWQRNQYPLLRVGYTREATTGSHASLVAKGLSSEGVAMVEAASDRFRRDFPLALLESLRSLSVQQTVSIVDQIDCGHSHLEQEIVSLKGYIEGRFVYENVAPCLWRWFWSSHPNRKPLSNLDDDQQSLVVLKVLQKHDWSYVVERLNFTGIKQARTALRQVFGKLYE